jgi:diguanylate cyclase (GGDEF)-like protein
MNVAAEYVDPLTGAHTRATLPKRLGDLIEHARRADEPLAVLVVDLDHFKSINDAFGHRRGDEALAEVTRLLRGVCRSTDMIFRYGGDEFVLLLPGTNGEQALVLAQRLLDRIGAETLPGDPPIALSLSVGAATYPEDASNAATLFDVADLRLNAAKRRGRGQVVAGEQSGTLVLPFEKRSRLIERDSALEAAHRFLNMLPDWGRGLLTIAGPPGAGRSALLAEFGKAARLRGYTALSLRARPALRGRPYGALSETWQGWGGWEAAEGGATALVSRLRAFLRELGAVRLIVLVDDLPYLDEATEEWLAALIEAPPAPTLGLVCVDTRGYVGGALATLHQEIVETAPISQGGLRIWLRTLLQWEPPAPFVERLHHATGGLPASVRRSLDALIERGVLRGGAGLWQLDAASDTLDVSPPPQPSLLYAGQRDFVGRSREIETVRNALAQRRLVTLVGPGGVGKTRLALQVAAELDGAFPHGVHVVSLGALADPEYLATTLADALGLALRPYEDVSGQIGAYFARRCALLVLDDFEHFVGQAGLLVDLLARAPELRVLVTSRERLRLAGEMLVEVGGLDLPDDESSPDAARSSAVQLFVQHVRVAHPRFTLSREELAHVGRICRLLGGLPLGIELAAAWAHVLPCAEIAAEIERGFDVLDAMGRERWQQRGLRAAFEHSWGLLTPQERRALRRLSVFRGPFTLEAASAVLHTGSARARRPEAGYPALRSVVGLLDKSLLRRAPGGRFDLHESIACYARERLVRAPRDRAEALAQHTRYYVEFVERQARELTGAGQKLALEVIDGEIENIRAVLEHVSAREPEAEARLIGALWRYWFLRGHFVEWARVFQDARERKGASSAPVRARALVGSAFLAYFKGEYRSADELCAEGLALARATQDSWLVAAALAMIGGHLDDHEAAVALLEESLARARQLEAPWLTAFVLGCAGAVALYRGRHAEARAALNESLALARAVGDRWLSAAALFHLGRLEVSIGDFAAARAHHAQALDLRRDLGDRLGMAYALLGLAEAALVQGDYAAARAYHEERLAVEESLSNRPGAMAATGDLGWVAFHQGDYGAAERLLGRSLEAGRADGISSGIANALLRLGLVALAQGRLDTAEAQLEESLAIWRQLNHRNGVAGALRGLADLALARGSLSAAAPLCREALALAVSTRTAALGIDLLVTTAELLARRGDTRAAGLLALPLRHPAATATARERARQLCERYGLVPPGEPAELFALAEELSASHALAGD